MTPLTQLADRIERAGGACRELDAEIELAIGNWTPEHFEAWHRFQECGESANPPLSRPVDPQWFTSSLDRALSLVSEGYYPTIDFVACRAWIRDAKGHDMPRGVAYGCGNTPALALTAAALRALCILAEEASAPCGRCEGEGRTLVSDRPRPDDISPPAHYEPCPECGE